MTEICIAVVVTPISKLYLFVLFLQAEKNVTAKSEKGKQFLSDSLSATSAWNSFHTVVHIAVSFAIFSDATAGENSRAFFSRADTLSVSFKSELNIFLRCGKNTGG